MEMREQTLELTKGPVHLSSMAQAFALEPMMRHLGSVSLELMPSLTRHLLIAKQVVTVAVSLISCS